METTAPTDTHWQELAGGYDEVMGADPAMHALYRAILDEMPPSVGAVLDLGTGTGALLRLVRARHPAGRLTGLDPAPAMLEQAREKMKGDPNVKFVLGSANLIDSPDGSFDVVVSNFALHHLTHEQKGECAREIWRVLVPGGLLIYGDQHCRRMGTPLDREWLEDMFDLFSAKALHYLHTAGPERMLLQVRLLPKFLLAEGEIPATVEYWQDCFKRAGLLPTKVIVAGPEFLYHRVLVAVKPGA